MSCPKCKSHKQFRLDRDTKVRLRNGAMQVTQYAPGTRDVNRTSVGINFCPFCGEKYGSVKTAAR